VIVPIEGVPIARAASIARAPGARAPLARAVVHGAARTLVATLVVAAFVVTGLAFSRGRARAQARVTVLLPDCHPAHLDTVVLPELLQIELEDVEGEAIEVALSNAICDPTARSLEAVIRDRARAREARESIEISDEPEPSSRARAIALSVAERARLILGRRPAPTPTPSEPSAADSADTGSAGDTDTSDTDTSDTDTSDTDTNDTDTNDTDTNEAAGARGRDVEPPRARETLASPIASPETATEPAPLPATPPPPMDELAPALTSSVAFRIAPVLPSWALGTRLMLRAHLDASFSLEGGVLALWSHAAPFDGNVDVLVVAAAGRAGYSLLRSSALDLTVLAGLELGVLAAFGAPDAAPGRTSAHPWLTAGASIELGLPLTRDLSITADVGASGVLFGTRVQTTAGPQIELAYLTIDLAVTLTARLPR
jgi:hypothetical protein